MTIEVIMETKVAERKNIIDSLKSIYGAGIFVLSIFQELLEFGTFDKGKIALLLR